jgi:hypothetical protein
MSDLGSQPREVWQQSDRLPAEGRLGSAENSSKPRRCLLLLPAWSSLHTCHLFGIRTLGGDLEASAGELEVAEVAERVDDDQRHHRRARDRVVRLWKGEDGQETGRAK